MASPKRILIIGPHRYTGGIQRYIDQEVEHLSSQYEFDIYDVEAVSADGAGKWPTALASTVADMARFPFKDQPDLVHIHTAHQRSFYRSAFYALYVKYVWDIPTVLHVHGSEFDTFVASNQPGVQQIQSLVYDAVDRVIVLSEGWRETLSTVVSDEKLTVLPNGVDTTAYQPRFDNHPHILFISHLIERKGTPELCAAIEHLNDRGLTPEVTIAGDGPLRDMVEELEAKYDHVSYQGYVSEEKKRELLSTATVYVLPTHAEGLPIAILEAMAGKNAIISTPVGAIGEVINDENGLLVDPGDSEGLATALEALISSKDITEQMASNNREIVEKMYDWSSIGDKLSTIFDSLDQT